MKENNVPIDIEEETDNNYLNINLTNNLLIPKAKDKNELPSLSEQLGEKVEPRIETLTDIIQTVPGEYDNISYKIFDKKNIILSKNLYISKDFAYMLILLISSGLNFSYLYFPFLIMAIFCFILFYKSSKNAKIGKKILEFLSLFYAVGLIVFKIYFNIQLRRDTDFGDKEQLLKDFGILSFIDKDSNYFFVASFIGEIFVIIISIYSLVISFISTDIDVSEYVDKDKKFGLKDFYSIMARCVYFFYFMVVGWSIFNRSILTLIYLMPMNVVIYFLSMKYKRKIIFYFFKFFSMIMILIVFAHLILINIFNIDSIRNYYLSDDLEIRDNYPRVVNAWTKLGINQAFHKDMKGSKLAEEFCGYLFGCMALLALIYTSKKMTFDKARDAFKEGKEEEENNNDIDMDDNYNEYLLSFWRRMLIKIKKLCLNPTFILHLCLISAILWLYSYQNYYSIGVIIWLFVAFLHYDAKSNKFITIVFLAPMVFICLFSYHLANIDGFIENQDGQKVYRNFALGKFSHKNVEYILCNIFFFLINYFIYTIIRVENLKTEETTFEKFLKRELKYSEERVQDSKERNDIISKIQGLKKEDADYEQKSKELYDLLEKNKKQEEERKKKKEENVIADLYHDLTFFNILAQLIYNGIDKITLIFIYLLAVNSINLIHLIAVIIFMIQLLIPKFVMDYSECFSPISQIGFLIEYIVELAKSSDYSEDTVNWLKLFFPFDLNKVSIDFLLYVITYCFYFQTHLNRKIRRSNILEMNKKINLEMYITVFLHKYPIIKKILFGIIGIINEIYKWVLIVIFIIFNGRFEISIFSAISLLIFLVIIYKFLKSVKNSKSVIKLQINYTLLIYSIINTFAVFIFQILCLDVFGLNEGMENSDNFFVKNLPALGFYRYFNNNLIIKFLPHFVSNVIANFLFNEMKSLKEKYEEKEKKDDRISLIGKDINSETLIKYKLNLEKLKEEKENEEKKEKEKRQKKITESTESKEQNIDTSSVIKTFNKKKSSNDISLKNEESEEIEPEKDSITEQYNENKAKITMLEFKNVIYNIILVATKFYWIFLFLFICIISTTYNLSIFIIIYIIIFGIIFIRMFHYIIMRLSAYNERGKDEEEKKDDKDKENKEVIREEVKNIIVEENKNKKEKKDIIKDYKPFFISKLIRYNLIEKNRHIDDNQKFRSLGFKYLILFNFFSYFLIYLDGIFDIVQGGCKYTIYDDCDKNHYKIIGEEGVFKNVSENVITSISYLIGFNANLNNGTILLSGWVHILFGVLLCFDAYVQNVENYFNKLCKINRREYRHLVNININLKAEKNKSKGEKNIILNIQNNLKILEKKEELKEIEKMEDIKEEQIEPKKKNVTIHYTKTIEFDFNSKQDQQLGEELIKKFENIFQADISKRTVKLSSSNNKTKIIKSLKGITEELIIFFLICTAVAKLNIWSLIYVIYAIYLILTKKTMKKYYILYCFVICSIIVQLSLFVSNLQKGTDPSADKADLEIMSKTFILPWYKYYGMKDERAFFFGLGVCHSQINLIWMDFLQVVIIYIYLDYFSYSIYQEGKTIGKSESQINYYNLHLNSEIREVTKQLSQDEYDKHISCMKYNFGIEIDNKVNDLNKFKYYIENGKEEKSEEDKKKEEEEEKKKKEEEEKKKKEEEEKKKEEEYISPLTKRLGEQLKAKEKEREKEKEKEERGKKTNLSNLKNKEFSGDKCINIVRNFFYLSFHNLILILILTISMMVSGFVSVVYIIISLYFLLTSTKIYLGINYSYPRAIKKLLRIMILVDIMLQIFYQIPFVDTKTDSNEENERNSDFYTILGYIGLNKIIVFGIDEEGNFDVDIGWSEMFLVLAKVLLYFLMSLQILIYSSPNFLEYYFGYIITKDRNLKRSSLMNVFKFNNQRIEVMNSTIKLRQENAEKMIHLEKTLERLSQEIKKKRQEMEAENEKIKEEEENNNIDNIDNAFDIEEVEEEEINKEEAFKTMIGGFTNLSKNLSDSSKNGLKKEKSKIVMDSIIQQKKSVSESLLPLKSNTLEISSEPYLKEKDVIKKVKEWILSGTLVKFQIGLHKLVANYNNIPEKEKINYERDMIQGKCQVNSYVETLIENELNAIDISVFTESEMKELKQYFDGSRKKKLEELKKKRKKLEKVKNTAKKIIAINKIMPKKEKTEEEKAKSKEFKVKIANERREIRLKSLNEKKKKINIRGPKYRNMREIAQNNIFAKYLTKSYLIQSIFRDLVSFLTNKFNWLCYFIMILNHIMNYSVISLFYPISIFCFAIMEYPRPRRSYWSICFIYTIIFLVIKFIIQLEIWKRIDGYDELFIKPLENYRIGLKLCEGTFSKDFFIYILFDALVLIFLLINNYLIIFDGFYYKREQEIESIYQANERIASTKDVSFNKPSDITNFTNDYLSKEESKIVNVEKKDKKEKKEKKVKLNKEEKEIVKQFDKFDKKSKGKGTFDQSDTIGGTQKLNYFERIKTNKKEKELEKQKEEEKRKRLFDESKRTYYEALFPEARNEKPGKEYYVSYTIAMTFIIVYVFLFYTIMIKDKTFGPVSMQTKQFSGEMVLFLLLHIGFLVADRIIYVRQNRNNLKYYYFLYDKINKKIIENIDELKEIQNFPLFKKDEVVIPPKYEEELKNYNIIYIQRETFNKPLFAKYLIHMLIVIFAHIFIFFYLPMFGNYKLNNLLYCSEQAKECNDFIKNTSLPIFYLIYLVYFFASGLQVKYGFYDMKKKSVLKRKSNSLYGGIYSGYKAIPFLYEIKLGIDWTFTSTCLDLFQWNKFESVYDVVYTTNCAMTGINNKPVGHPVKKGSKIGMGGVLTFALLLILVGPLFLFSTLNPTNELNNLTNADLTVELSFIYKNKLMKNYTLYQNLNPQSIEPISTKDFDDYNYSKCVDTKNFPKEQIETVLFFIENDRNWDLSLPHIKNLIELIQSRNKNISKSDENYITRIDLIMDYNFYRKLPPEAQEVKKRYNSTIFERGENYKEGDHILGELGDALENCEKKNITFKNFFSPPIRLRATSHPKALYKDNKDSFTALDVQLGFEGCRMINNTPNYLESFFTFAMRNPKTDKMEGIKYHIFSDKVSSTTQSYSALTFYVALVLVAGNYIRNFFSGQPEKIILTEMPNNKDIMDLCEGIKISRYSYDFEEEEKLYYILI